MRKIVQLTHLSFGTIGKIDRRIDAQNNNDEIEVQEEFWALNQHYDLALADAEIDAVVYDIISFFERF